MKLTRIVAGFCVAGTMAIGTGSAAAEIRLSVADSFPSGHYLQEEAAKFWMDRVIELTDGEVQFDYFTSGQMGPLADMLDMARTRIADITYVPMSSFAAELPLSGVTELPGFFDTAVRGTAAFQDFLDSYLDEAEFDAQGVRPLFGAMLPPYQIASADGPIETMGDVDGVRLRTPGGILEIAAEQVGATAVPMGGPDMYAALQRGTVDATVNAYASLKGYRLNEVLEAVSDNASFGSFAFTYVINEDRFNELPENIQNALLQAGDETAAHVAEWMDENERVIAEEFAAEGIEIYSIDPEQLAAMNGALSAVAQIWAERLDERGQPGSETLAKWQEALAEAE